MTLMLHVNYRQSSWCFTCLVYAVPTVDPQLPYQQQPVPAPVQFPDIIHQQPDGSVETNQRSTASRVLNHASTDPLQRQQLPDTADELPEIPCPPELEETSFSELEDIGMVEFIPSENDTDASDFEDEEHDASQDVETHHV